MLSLVDVAWKCLKEKLSLRLRTFSGEKTVIKVWRISVCCNMPTIFYSFNKTAGKNHVTPEIIWPSSLPSWYTPSPAKTWNTFVRIWVIPHFFLTDGDSCCPWNVMSPVRAQHVRSRWLSSHSSLSLSLNWRRARSFSRCFSLSI